MSQVNLLPPDLRQRQATRRTTVLAVLAGAAAVVLVVLFTFVQSARLSQVEGELHDQQSVNARVQAQIGQLEKFGQLQAQLQTKKQLLSSVFADEVSWSAILMDVSRVIPSDAYLTNLSGQIAATGAAGTSGTQPTGLVGSLTFSGTADGTETLASWLTRLEQVRGWVNAWANSANESAPFSRVYQFNSGVDLSQDALTPRGKGASS